LKELEKLGGKAGIGILMSLYGLIYKNSTTNR